MLARPSQKNDITKPECNFTGYYYVNKIVKYLHIPCIYFLIHLLWLFYKAMCITKNFDPYNDFENISKVKGKK